MKNSIFMLVLLCGLWVSAPVVKAQNAPIGSSNEPLEITADDSLEWNRADQKFIARQKAVATQGLSSVAADTLTARYRSTEQSDIDIYLLIAEGHVRIANQTSTAYGDHATYNLDDGLATLTGDNLRLVSPDQTITAQKRFEYWLEEGRAVAIGRPHVVRPKPGGGQDTLDTDELVAHFTDNAQGERIIDTLEATGNVVITTPAETVYGAYGIYRAATNKVELTGKVSIMRGPNVLKGERAIVDLNTNISTIFGKAGDSTGKKGRVRGVFYPNSEKKNKKPSPPDGAPLTR